MKISYLEKLIKLNETEHTFSVSVACAFINRHQKNIFSWQSNMGYPAASLAKLFILGAVAEEIAIGRCNAKQHITVTDYVAGSGLLKYIRTPSAFTLDDLIYLMVAYSDNNATNRILSFLTQERVNEFIGKLGARNTQIVVPMMSTVSEAARGHNYTTADDVLLFYKGVVNGFPPPINQKTASLCRDFFAPSRGSFTNVARFLLSTVNTQCIMAIAKRNLFIVGKYLYTVLSPLWRRRLTKYVVRRRIAAQKSATDKNIFHDSCVIELPDGFLCIVSMIECSTANFYKTMSGKYKSARFLTRRIGKILPKVENKVEK